MSRPYKQPASFVRLVIARWCDAESRAYHYVSRTQVELGPRGLYPAAHGEYNAVA